MADGKWQMADGKWQMADGESQMADGESQMADGGWQMPDGTSQMANSAVGHKPSAIGHKPLSIPGLTVHAPPQPGHTYVIGADPAEGNPQSDESAAVVLDYATGEQVATLGLRCDPEMFAIHLNRLAMLYDDSPLGAQIMVERDNHGHGVIMAPRYIGASLLSGPDREMGWATTGPSKHLMFDQAAKDIREGGLRLHDRTTYRQLASIDGATLAAPQAVYRDEKRLRGAPRRSRFPMRVLAGGAAPPGQHPGPHGRAGAGDDRAMACVLALAALHRASGPDRGKSFVSQPWM